VEVPERFGRHAEILVSIIAVFLAVAALLAEESMKQILLYQAAAMNEYTYLQEHSLKKHADNNAAAVLQNVEPSNIEAPQEAKTTQKAGELHERAREAAAEEDSRLAEAQHYEELLDEEEQRHRWLQWSQGAFELSVVLTSVAIVARAVWLVWVGTGMGVAGLTLLAPHLQLLFYVVEDYPIVCS